MKIRVISWLLILGIVCSVLPASVHAEETSRLEDLRFAYINPMYADCVTEEDLVSSKATVLNSDNTVAGIYYDAKSAGEMIRDDLVARDTTISVNLTFPYNGDTIQQDAQDQIYAVMANAFAHTGSPVEGDYLLWQFTGFNVETANPSVDSTGKNVRITVTYTMTYHSSAEQEDEMNSAVSELLERLDVYDADSYTKLKAIYDYITANVTYDNANLNNNSYTLKHTAYAALINKTAVCQGYAALFYRLALELGVDCRMIPGESSGQGHVWNIAQAGELYYNLDATMDAGLPRYQYFLIGSDDFANHDRWDKPGNLPTVENYNSDAFHAAYPMSESSYSMEPIPDDPESSGSCGDHLNWELTDDSVLTISGSGNMTDYDGENAPWYPYRESIRAVVMDACVTGIGTYAFSGCSVLTTVFYRGTAEQKSEILIGDFNEPLTAAQWHYQVTDEIYNGQAAYRCGKCGDYYAPTGAKLGHEHLYSPVVTAPTCTDEGYTTYTCVCGDYYIDDPTPALGHGWDQGVVTREPSPEKNGIRTFTCTVCHETRTEEIPYIAPQKEILRLAGEGRVETALEVAEQLKTVLGLDKFSTIVIANGDNFADALAGSYLAARKNAPILLHRGSGKGDNLNERYIEENLTAGGTVYLLGGTAVVPASIEESLNALGYRVIRLAGDTRFDTNLKILEEAGVEAGNEILITTAWDFADCLAASATGKPILMLNTVTDKLTESQKEFLANYAENDFIIIGGPAAVSEKLQDDIEAIAGDTGRIFGKSREETAASIGELFFKNSDCVLLAYSRNFPDGLCGGPLAHAMNAPLLLVSGKREAPAADYVSSNGILRGIVLGGAVAVSEESMEIIFGE